jgi:hypothetical protein
MIAQFNRLFLIALPALRRKKTTKDKARNSNVAPRRTKISQHSANTPVDCDAIFVHAVLPPSLW